MKLGEAMYRAQQSAGGKSGGGSEPVPTYAGGPRRPRSPGIAAGTDKVVDADFEEVDDQKRRGSA